MGYDLFLILFFILLVAVPVLMFSVRVVEWLMMKGREVRQEQEAEAHVKRVMGEE